jgi:hypothetical protein
LEQISWKVTIKEGEMDDFFGFNIGFLDMKFLAGITVILWAWIQWTKEYFPDLTIAGRSYSLVKPWTFASGFLIAYLGAKCGGIICSLPHLILYAVASASLSSFGYELLKGTKLGLRSSSELKNGKNGGIANAGKT